MQPALGFLTKLSLLKCATVLSNATFSCSTRCTRLTVLWCGHLEPYSTATVPPPGFLSLSLRLGKPFTETGFSLASKSADAVRCFPRATTPSNPVWVCHVAILQDQHKHGCVFFEGTPFGSVLHPNHRKTIMLMVPAKKTGPAWVCLFCANAVSCKTARTLKSPDALFSHWLDSLSKWQESQGLCLFLDVQRT